MVGVWAATFALFSSAIGSTVPAPSFPPLDLPANNNALQACVTWKSRAQNSSDMLGPDSSFPTLASEWLFRRSLTRNAERQSRGCDYLAPPPPPGVHRITGVLIGGEECAPEAQGGELLMLGCELDEWRSRDDPRMIDTSTWPIANTVLIGTPVDVVVG